MKTATATAKVKVSAISLMEAPAVNAVSAWAILLDGKEAGKVIWTIGNGGTWKCAVMSWEKERFGIVREDSDALDYRLTSKVIGSAGGGGYDKRTAAFEDCLTRNGIVYTHFSKADEYLAAIGFTVIETI